MKHEEYSNLYVNTKPDDVAGNVFTVAFDMDSVLNEMGDCLGKYIADSIGCPEKKVRGYVQGAEGNMYRTFHFENELISSKEIYEMVLRYILKESDKLAATPYMRAVTRHVYEVTNVPVCIVTARPRITADTTHRWLTNNLDVPFIVYMVASHTEKAAVLEAIECDMFVDDRYRTVDKLEGIVNLPFLYKRDWNTNRDEYLGMITIDDLRGMLPFINIGYGIGPLDFPTGIPFPSKP